MEDEELREKIAEEIWAIVNLDRNGSFRQFKEQYPLVYERYVEAANRSIVFSRDGYVKLLPDSAIFEEVSHL